MNRRNFLKVIAVVTVAALVVGELDLEPP